MSLCLLVPLFLAATSSSRRNNVTPLIFLAVNFAPLHLGNLVIVVGSGGGWVVVVGGDGLWWVVLDGGGWWWVVVGGGGG